ncbi:threonine--tRNA ligase [candidate division KSB1 bacterium]
MSTVITSEKVIEIEFPDGSKNEFPINSTPLDIAEHISGKLAKEALIARFNGELIDLTVPLRESGSLEILTFDSSEGKEVYWHSSSHLMAQAVKRLWPQAMIAIGPPVDTGFYYDIDLDISLTNDDLRTIEAEMKKIIKEDLPVSGREVTKEEALDIFDRRKENYKKEIISLIPDGDLIKVYSQGEFTDLCRGPHLASTGKIKHFQLTSLAGAYWRGDERNQMLQRIYGVAFPKEKQLKDYEKFLEESRKRDHRKLGKELDLFSFHQEAPGFVFWHGNGLKTYNEILKYWREVHEREDYIEINTPIILNEELWHRSGHWDNYKENMYFTEIDKQVYAVKPMNCPGGLLVYKNRMYSYKDLPVKMGELGLVHRHEKSGVLHGLMRVRQFTQDDAHVYCMESQVKDEVIKIIKLVFEIYNAFGFEDIFVELSTKPEKSIGSDEIWDISEQKLAEALDDLEIDYKVNKGEGAFYGPKIDFHIKDCLRRMWQCGTIQLDFSMPERLGASYIDSESRKQTPVMIHRAILGSIERFMGILIEQYGGDLPLWLAPEQVVLIPVSEKHHEYAKNLYEQFKKAQLRVRIDTRSEKVGYKIRDNELKKIPCMCILGDREVESGTVSVRRRFKGDLGTMEVDSLIEELTNERRLRL